MVDSLTAMDVDDPEINGQDQAKKNLKRKRAYSLLESLSTEQKEAQIKSLNQEIEGLFEYYREMIGQKRGLGLDSGLSECNSVNSMVAALMEESGLPLSKLVGEIYVKVKEKVGNMTMAAVKTALLFVGQRVIYGMPNADADVLEDDTDSCLWCWETRDLKLMPKSARGTLKIRRTCRKKIHERITAVSAMIAALKRSESDQAYKHDIMKLSEKLGKVLSEADVRLLVGNMLLKDGADMAKKEANREENMLIKQLERNTREAEKEKKRMDREIQKEKLQSEKEQKRLQESGKEEKRREKEQSEMRKQLKKQQDEAEKDQRRREKEEAELKKQLAIRKQALVMEKFLKRSKTIPSSQNDQSSSKATASDSLSKRSENVSEAVTESMDCALLSNSELNIDDLRKSHVSFWNHLGHSVRSNPKQLWGIRKKPKIELFKELKLVDGWGEKSSDDRSCLDYSDSLFTDVKKFNRRKQLLQFDKSHRPAFYGFFPKKSQVVGPRHPSRKDPDLDYDVDSDEEWEEEEPGESLSDCDKAEEEESLEEGCSKADDEDESEDEFFVPDGYLSENEGVQVDRRGTDPLVEEAKSSPSCKQDLESEEFCALLQQQKHLHNLTVHALRKNQPLIVLNLMHEKAPLLVAVDLSGTPKLEQMCLQALSVRVFSGLPPVEISIDNIQDEDQEACLSNGKGSTTPVSTLTTIPDADLPTIVSVIQSCSQGINKVVESLQTKFPDIPKSQLRNKVREISDFADNCWQVKKDILVKLGLSISPGKGGGRAKSIATFFSKRCLPPSGKSINPIETSPQPSLKSGSAVQGQHGYTCDNV